MGLQALDCVIWASEMIDYPENISDAETIRTYVHLHIKLVWFDN